MPAVQVRISGVEALEDFNGQYQVFVVECTKGAKKWLSKQRYSAFDDLRKVIAREGCLVSNPFPGKQLFGKLNAAATARRKDQLDLWLRELCGGLEMMPTSLAVAFEQFVCEPSGDASAPGAVVTAAATPPQSAPPAKAWDDTFMTNDPLAGLMAPPPSAPPAPVAVAVAEPAAAPRAAVRPPSAPCGAAPAFLAKGAAAKTYEVTGEGLRDAVKSGDVAGVKLVLAQNPSLCTYQDRQMESMLHLAAIFNLSGSAHHAAIALELIDAGADVEAKNSEDETPLDVALPSLKAKILTRLAKRDL